MTFYEFLIIERLEKLIFPLPSWPPARRAYASERRGQRGGGG